MSSWHANWRTKKKNAQKREGWEFSGGPMVRTPCSHCQGPGFDSVVGELSAHKSHSMIKKKKKHIKRGEGIKSKENKKKINVE